MASRTVQVPFSVLFPVPVTLTVRVPVDEEGSPDTDASEIVSVEVVNVGFMTAQDASERISNDSVEADDFDKALREALGINV